MSDLPHREETLPVEKKDRTCSCCGSDKTHVGYQTSSRLHVIPARFEVVVEKREKLACPNGCEGQFVTAPLPLRVFGQKIRCVWAPRFPFLIRIKPWSASSPKKIPKPSMSALPINGFGRRILYRCRFWINFSGCFVGSGHPLPSFVSLSTLWVVARL